MAASVAASVAAVQAETEVSDCLASVVSGQWTMDSGQWTARPDSKAGQPALDTPIAATAGCEGALY